MFRRKKHTRKISNTGAGMDARATATPKIKRHTEPKLTIKGYAGITIRREDGTVVERRAPAPNYITQAGFEWIADSLYDGTEPAGQARWLGLSATSVSGKNSGDNFTVTDITTPAGLARKETNNSPYAVTPKTMSLDATFTNATSDTGTRITGITTLTVYSAKTGGTLIHAVHTAPFALNAGDSVEVDWTITFSEP